MKPIVPIATLILLLSGCIELESPYLDQDDAQTASAPSETSRPQEASNEHQTTPQEPEPAPGRFTTNYTVADRDVPCDQAGVATVLGQVLGVNTCVEREHRILGEIDGVLQSLDIAIQNGIGDIVVKGDGRDDVELVVQVVAKALDRQQARDTLDRSQFRWGSDESSAAQLWVEVGRGQASNGLSLQVGTVALTPQLKARALLVVPQAQLVGLDLGTPNAAIRVMDLNLTQAGVRSTNGDILLERLAAQRLNASSTNGGLDVRDVIVDEMGLRSTNGALDIEDSSAQTAVLDFVNGDVVADDLSVATLSVDMTNGGLLAMLVPTASGSFRIDSTNGEVVITVPETPEQGYNVSARSTNGERTIHLHDGDVKEAKRQTTFVSEAFEERAIQTSVDIRTTNGDVWFGSEDPETGPSRGVCSVVAVPALDASDCP